MEGLQTHHHAPCELDIEGSFQLWDLFQRATTFSTSEGKKKTSLLFAQAISSSHSPKYIAFFFLNISLKLKLSADTLL